MPIFPFVNYAVQNPLSSDITLNNDQNTFLNIFTLDSTTVKSAVVEYSIVRGSTTEVGRLFIATDGITISMEQDKANNVDTGITLYGSLSGTIIQVQYLSTNTGQTATFRYSQRVLN